MNKDFIIIIIIRKKTKLEFTDRVTVQFSLVDVVSV